MIELSDFSDLILGVVTFLVVALVTLSLALFWEGGRRWLRARAANRALQKVGPRVSGAGKDPDAGESLVREERPPPAWLEPVLLRLPHREDLQRLLEQAGLRWSVGTLALLCLGVAAALGLAASVATRGPLLPVVAAALGAYLPLAYVRIKRKRRFAAFEEGFSEAIDLLARAARAGHSLTAGLQVAGEEAEEPVAGEFRQVYEEQRFGLPMKDSLLAMADRIDLVDVRIFVTAVLIQRESGGNLAENLDGLSRVIRERFRFKRDVKTKTAHGRMTAGVVGLAPVIAGVGMYTLNPDYMTPLFVEPLGRLLLMAGTVLMFVGFVTVRRMADLKV